MATFRKLPQRDGGQHWQAVVRIEGHPARYKTFSTLTDAKRWARNTEIEIEEDTSGISNEAARHTLSDLIEQYRAKVLPDLQPTTARPYATHLKYWQSELGALRLSELHPQKIAERRDALIAAGAAPATCNRYLATLGAVLTAGVQLWHWLPASPMKQVHKPTERNQRGRFLTEAELDRLLVACRQSESPDLLLGVLLAITTGARKQEILGLRWRDIDWPRGIIHLRQGVQTTTKGGTRSAAIAAAVLPLLRARFDAYTAREQASKVPSKDPQGELIFPSRVTRSKPVDLRRPFMTALERANIRNFVWHDLRHSAASFLAKGGASLVEIGAVLGHRSANTTRRYAHLVEEHVHDLTRAMSARLLTPAPSPAPDQPPAAVLHSVEDDEAKGPEPAITPDQAPPPADSAPAAAPREGLHDEGMASPPRSQP